MNNDGGVFRDGSSPSLENKFGNVLRDSTTWVSPVKSFRGSYADLPTERGPPSSSRKRHARGQGSRGTKWAVLKPDMKVPNYWLLVNTEEIPAALNPTGISRRSRSCSCWRLISTLTAASGWPGLVVFDVVGGRRGLGVAGSR
ncbi:hypothetical protein Droror1_Dr00027139 [Drosera rotundifolia]